MGDGKRVSKDHPAIAFLGDLDELNSHLGLALAAGGKEWAEELTSIQQDIFNIGGEASMSDTDIALLDDSRISRLESAIKEMNGKLPPLKEFILPGEEIDLEIVIQNRGLSDSDGDIEIYLSSLNNLISLDTESYTMSEMDARDSDDFSLSLIVDDAALPCLLYTSPSPRDS